MEGPPQQEESEHGGRHEEARALTALGSESARLRLVELDLIAHDARQLAGDQRDEAADAGACLGGGRSVLRRVRCGGRGRRELPGLGDGLGHGDSCACGVRG